MGCLGWRLEKFVRRMNLKETNEREKGREEEKLKEMVCPAFG